MFKPIELSFTRCKTSRCGFRFQHEQSPTDQHDDPGEFAVLGIQLHIIAAKLAYRCQKEGLTSDIGYGRYLVKQLLDQPHWDDFARNHIEITGDRLSEIFTLPRDYQKPLIIEQRLAVDRNLQVIAPGTQVDRFEGTPDLAWIATGGKTGGLVDWKCGPGPPQLDYSEAKEDRQLLAYSALMFLHNPELEYIAARKNFVRWKSGEQSPWDWNRDACVEAFGEWVSDEFRRIDELRNEYGDNQWPATPRADTCENYCSLSHICPAYLELRDRLETMGVETKGKASSSRKVGINIGNRNKHITPRRRR